jgi:hypothetical protein
MNGAPHDLRDYFFDELSAAEKAEVVAWLATSLAGREELARLQATNQALLGVPDEEIPQRIAFVSDKVFEPSPWARFASWLQLEGPRFALGSAAAMAVLFAGIWVTAPSLRYDDSGFELAFGAEAPIAIPVPTPVQTLTDEQVRAVALAVLAETSSDREAQLVALIDQRAAQTEQRLSREVAAVSEDAEMGYRLLRGDIDKIYNMPDLALVTR